MTLPIIDLHCDLLFYLARSKECTPYDRVARCSIPQLVEGSVKLQTMAIFTKTEAHSVENGQRQANIFKNLPTYYPKDFVQQLHWQSPSIAILMAIENASGFCNEQESLQEGLSRLKDIITNIAKPLYISLTWNTENRFGGGTTSKVGLKADGKLLLEEIQQQQIAIDLSHTSDALAYDIIDYIEGHRLQIPLMASHSNVRAVKNMPRNLPDEIAKEIFKRQGIIGFNLYRPFIGDSEEMILKHISHWLELGGENHIGFGSDFFYDPDIPTLSQQGKENYFKDYQDASCYGKLLAFIQKELKVASSFIEKLAHQNALSFIQSLKNDFK